MNASPRALLTAAVFGLALLVAVPAEARPAARPSSPVSRGQEKKSNGNKSKVSRPRPAPSKPKVAPSKSRATRPAPGPSRISPPSSRSSRVHPSRATPARPPPAPSRGHAASPARPVPARGHAASPVPVRGSGSAHAASAVPWAAPGHSVHENCCPDHYPQYWASYSSHSHVYVEPSHHHGHVVTHSEPGPSAHHHSEFMAMVQPTAGGLGLGLGILIDGANLGVDLRAEQLVFANEIPGLRGQGMSLFDAALTGRLFGGERGRMRAHLGLTSGFSRDVTYLAPFAGVSATARVLGPLTTEASAQLALLPYTRLDTRAGLGLRLGVVELRGGARMLVLNDQGRVTGESNTDVLAGPYVSAGLVF